MKKYFYLSFESLSAKTGGPKVYEIDGEYIKDCNYLKCSPNFFSGHDGIIPMNRIASSKEEAKEKINKWFDQEIEILQHRISFLKEQKNKEIDYVIY